MGYAPLIVNCCLLARTGRALLQTFADCHTANDQENDNDAAKS
jgi:hypothetical protein